MNLLKLSPETLAVAHSYGRIQASIYFLNFELIDLIWTYSESTDSSPFNRIFFRIFP